MNLPSFRVSPYFVRRKTFIQQTNFCAYSGYPSLTPQPPHQEKMVREFGFEPYESIVYGRRWLTVDDTLEIKYPKLRNYALNSLFHRFLRQNPPNFDEAFRAADAIDDSTYGKYPHDPRISQEWCYSLIAIKQLLMKQTDDAEKTLQLFAKSSAGTRLISWRDS